MGKLILAVLQLAVGWFAGQAIVSWLKLGGGELKIGLYVIVFAGLCWIAGLVAAEILQGVGKPAPRALVSSLVVAGIAAALLFIPQVRPYLSGIPDLYLPLVGAVIGYHIRA